MRKLLLALSLVLLIGGQVFAQGYAADPGVGDILGQGKYQSDAHKIFRMVHYVPVTYNGSTDVTAPAIAVWDKTLDDGVTVTLTTTSADSSVAGIIVTRANTPDVSGNTAVQNRGKDNWTWLQTYGLSTVDFLTLVDDVGSQIGTSTTAEEAAMCTPNTTQPERNGCFGFAYDTATAGDDGVQVFINGLD